MAMEYGVSEIMVNASPLENPSISLRDPQVYQSIFGGGESDAGVSVTPTTALGYAPLWRAINLVSGDVAKLPLNVYRRLPDGGKEKARTHPAWSLLNRQVTDAVDSVSFKECLTAHALLRGNGYAVIQRDGRGDPVELLILNPAETYAAMLNGDVWYVTHINGEQVPLRSDDVFHVKGLSPDGLIGYDIVTLMADALSVGMAASKFGARFFGQGSNMSGLLMVPGSFSDSKMRNSIAAFDSMVSGIGKSHRIGLLQDGVKFQPMTIAPEQAQFLQTREFEIRATVANIIGCPPHKLGDNSKTSYSSLEAENQSYLDECLNRWLVKWEVEASRKLLRQTEYKNDTHFVEFNRNALLRMSSTDRANFYSRLQEHGNLTINDVMRSENLPTIGEKGDRRYRPANLMEIGDESDAAMSAAEPAAIGSPANNSGLLRAMVSSSVTRAVTIEKDRVVRAAKNEDNFCAWLDSFYTAWIANSSTTADTATAFIGHAATSKHQLLDVAGSATQTSLAGAVAECVATWSDRGRLLTTTIMEQDNG